MSEPEDNYAKYRGKCREMAEALAAEKPGLTVVRGFYYCPVWNSEEKHWWCVDADGRIEDPTRLQFPSAGLGVYREYDGVIRCEQCGAGVPEKEAYFDEHHAFCDARCFARCVGLEQYLT